MRGKKGKPTSLDIAYLAGVSPGRLWY